GLHVRTNVLSNDGAGPLGSAAVQAEHQAHGRKGPCADRPSANLARDYNARGRVEPVATGMGELLQGGIAHQGVSRGRQLHGGAVAPVAAVQIQSPATPRRDISTPASVRALPARPPDTTWPWPVGGEGGRSWPRAGC